MFHFAGPRWDSNAQGGKAALPPRFCPGDKTLVRAIRRRPIVVAMAQATFSWPFGPIHLESTRLRFRLVAKTALVPLLLLFPANPLRWASPGGTREITQNAAGDGSR